MAPRSSGPVFTSTIAEAEVAHYRPLCALAVVAMVVGMLSVLALFDPMFWFLPVLGIVLAAVSLRWIAASEPPLIGRGAALAGLGLSVVFGVAAPADFYYFRWNLRQEAREFGLIYLNDIAEGKPEVANQLMELPGMRYPLDDDVWNAYPANSDARTMLEGLVQRRGVHSLLLLGKRALVRYYDTDSQSVDNQDHDCVVQSFAVTFDSAEGEKQTFFLRLFMERSLVGAQRRAFWRVQRIDSDILPVSRGGKPPQA